MIHLKNIAVIGGDLRVVKLIELFEKDHYQVHTYGLEKADSLKKCSQVTFYKTIGEAVKEADVVIGPIPLSSNKIDVNMLFSDEKLTVEELIHSLREGQILIAGNLYDKVYQLGNEAKVRIIDLLQREEFAVLNAISTAEGAIEIAIQETISTIHSSHILVMGFGRIGKVLAKMLDGLGANVYCEARKYSDLAWIKAYGYHPIYLRDLNQTLGKFDVIINTIPHQILTEQRLQLVRPDCLMIDVASNPGGIDRNAAKMQKKKVIWALSLPGKVAPATTAEYIKETVYNIFNEIENK